MFLASDHISLSLSFFVCKMGLKMYSLQLFLDSKMRCT